MQLLLQIVGIWISVILQDFAFSCNQKVYFDENSFVCACNSTYCDLFENVTLPEPGYFHQTLSSKEQYRFYQSTNLMNSTAGQATSFIFVNDTDIRQEMIGFGGAFTDSAGIAIDSLSPDVQETLLRSYFAPDGLEYNIGRIPIAGCDFSTYPYSYDDVEGDVDLVFFNLTKEDYLYKLPFLKRAAELNERPMLFFGSPWSPPSWMKTNGMFNGSGGLLPEMRQPWSNYFVKFVEAYQQEGVDIWGLTVENEPSLGYTDYEWNACGFTAEEERDFIRDYLGPTLNASGLRSVKLMAADDNRQVFPDFPTTILEDPNAAKYVDGVAVHWYADTLFPPSLISAVHNRFPDKFLLYTEACTGYQDAVIDVKPVRLGFWDRAEDYILDIIENVNHWVTGWVDWNLALDMEGGPNWALNTVDSPIIVNKDANEFYKQPMYYAMGHFSKFVPEGSISLGLGSSTPINGDVKANRLEAAAFTDPTYTYTTVIIANAQDKIETVEISDTKGNSFLIDLPMRSFASIIYS